MGVGVSKPMASSPSCKEDSKLNELKFKLRWFFEKKPSEKGPNSQIYGDLGQIPIY
jgi:hypothetical protein